MERKTKGKLDCKELSTGLRMNEHTLDALVTPGHYKIEPCDVTSNEGFPQDVPQGRLSAYLEITSTNHSSDRLKDNAIGQVLTVTDSDGVTNIYTRNRTNSDGINIWSAWSGVGGKSAGDIMDGAITAQKLSSDIRPNVVSPLRPLFIAAGAEYNDTRADILKTAPWGENVLHRPWHYYLNGLGDITEKQMAQITCLPYNGFYSGAYQSANARTTLLTRTSSLAPIKATLRNWFDSSIVEVIGVKEVFYSVDLDLTRAFSSCSKLKYILYTPFICTNAVFTNTFYNCKQLQYIRLSRLNSNVSFEHAVNIQNDSILYIITNALPSNAITITLHPDAYNRLKDDADIIAALESQPLVTLVCA